MKDRLSDAQEDDPLYLFDKRQQFRTEIVGKVLKDLPLVIASSVPPQQNGIDPFSLSRYIPLPMLYSILLVSL